MVHSTEEYANGIINQAGLGKPSNELLNAVANDLLTGFHTVVPNLPSPSYMKAHRWYGTNFLSFLFCFNPFKDQVMFSEN